MINVRPFNYTDEDYRIGMRASNANYPEYKDSLEIWKHNDVNRDKTLLFKRYILELNGEGVGFGYILQSSAFRHPGLYRIGWSILPEAVGHGLRRAFYQYGMTQLHQLEEKPTCMMCSTREDKSAEISLLQTLGFQQVKRYPISRLNKADFDPQPHLGALKKSAEAGIEIMSFDRFREVDAEADRKLWYLDEHQIMKDVPLPYEYTPKTFENWLKGVSDHPHFRPEFCWVGVKEGELVGLSGLYYDPGQPTVFFTGLTGVLRDYRRAGVATSLKLSALSRAFECGAEEVETDNEENNPMYQLNLHLG
ncbi:MAG: GNAT family N-acetyltransferase, partial [Chloroflexota bacterium]